MKKIDWHHLRKIFDAIIFTQQYSGQVRDTVERSMFQVQRWSCLLKFDNKAFSLERWAVNFESWNLENQHWTNGTCDWGGEAVPGVVSEKAQTR